MSEEIKSGDNGKTKIEEPQFDCFIKILYNTKTKDFAFETNVPDCITGYGLCDLGKKGVDSHIAKLQQARIASVRGNMVNFARRIFK